MQFEGKNFRDCFEFVGKDIIAEGSFGTVVRRVREKKQGTVSTKATGANNKEKELAVKCIRMQPSTRKPVKQEVAILKELREHTHNIPGIVSTIASFQSSADEVHIVMDFCREGDVFDKLVEREYFSEAETRRMFRNVITGIKALHELDIVHRDVKLENLLLDKEGSLVLCDFGYARKVKQGCRTDCGTRNYAAPEILLGKTYSFSVDVWSLAVCVFMCTTGYHPFETGKVMSTFSNICDGKMILHEESWGSLSPEGKQFLEQLLTVDVKHRPTIADVLKHPWMKDDSAPASSDVNALIPAINTNLTLTDVPRVGTPTSNSSNSGSHALSGSGAHSLADMA